MKIKCVPHLQKQNNTSFRCTPKNGRRWTPFKKSSNEGLEDINVCTYSVFLSTPKRRHLWSISSLLFTPSYDFPSVRYIIMHKIMMEKTQHQQPTLSVCQHTSLYQPFNDQKIYLSIKNGFFLPVSNFRKIVLPLNLLSERFFCTSLELALLFFDRHFDSAI